MADFASRLSMSDYKKARTFPSALLLMAYLPLATAFPALGRVLMRWVALRPFFSG